MMAESTEPRLAVRRLVTGHDRLGRLIIEHRLNHLRAEENFLVAVYLDWLPGITRIRQRGVIPSLQVGYWAAALTWLEEVLAHPDWVSAMVPFEEDYDLTAAMTRIEQRAWQPDLHRVVDLAVARIQVHLRDFQLATQSVGELAMIQRYWELTNPNEKD